ncbi:MAG: ACP S-malonyltransferase [Gemmatimonadota bacterium]|nr:ACP S-malonyltransferase [Gemmatimonadota bacterium]
MCLALLFPGQGSQHVGMGRSLANTYPEAACVFEEADDVLGFSISKLAWEGPEEDLVLTKNAQPAMLVHSTAVNRVIQGRLGEVGMAAGHSLGEFSAHVAAGTLDFAEGVLTVRLRGELMYAVGLERPGTMAAVIGLDDESVVSVCEQAQDEASVCVPANFNATGQVVISGDLASVELAMDYAMKAGAKRVVRLSVSGGFHSPLMAPAEAEFEDWLAPLSFHDPAFPVIANVTAKPVSTGDAARALLIRQFTTPVQWAASVLHMADCGADRFLEIGPGSVLRGLNRRIVRRIPCVSLGEPEDLDEWEP